MCWCGGSPWRHQYRVKQTGIKEPMCEDARANLRIYMDNWLSRPGNRERDNKNRRARRIPKPRKPRKVKEVVIKVPREKVEKVKAEKPKRKTPSEPGIDPRERVDYCSGCGGKFIEPQRSSTGRKLCDECIDLGGEDDAV